MAYLVFGVILAAATGQTASNVIPTAEDRFHIGIITGGHFGPGSFSIGVDGHSLDKFKGDLGDSMPPNPTSYAADEQPNSNEQYIPVIRNIGLGNPNISKGKRRIGQNGKGGRGGTGGGQITIGSICIPNKQRHRVKVNKNRNYNRKYSNADSSAEYDYYDDNLFKYSQDQEHDARKNTHDTENDKIVIKASTEIPIIDQLNNSNAKQAVSNNAYGNVQNENQREILTENPGHKEGHLVNDPQIENTAEVGGGHNSYANTQSPIVENEKDRYENDKKPNENRWIWS